jgi:protein arginine kinase activator
MADTSKCHICGASATVHLTQILNNNVHKVDLCEDCAQKKGVLTEEGFSLADLIGKSLAPSLKTQDPEKLLSCKHCDLTVMQLKKTGRLGCAKCYDTLAPVISTVIKNLHKDNSHKGKVPTTQCPKLPPSDNVEQLLLQLNANIQQAIKEERYEDAARYRDEIAKLKP